MMIRMKVLTHHKKKVKDMEDMDKVLLGKEDKDLEVVIMLADKTEIRKSTENMDMVILFQ